MLNTHFQNTLQGGTATNEFDLYEDLIIESIRQYGFDTQYLPRTAGAFDNLFGEDPLVQFNQAPTVEMYIKSVEGFEGEGDFLSRFGLEIRDSMTLTVAKKRFTNFQTEHIMSETGSNMLMETGDELLLETATDEGYSISLDRPREGDLIFFPLTSKIYEVKFVEHESVFYQLGKLYVWDLRVELYDYSSERINTGNSAIDVIETTYSADMLGYEVIMETGFKLLREDGGSFILESYNPGIGDKQANNVTFNTGIVTDSIINFTERNPFSEATY